MANCHIARWSVLFVIGLLGLGWGAEAFGQAVSLSEDTLWSADQGAGQLTEPGSSRRLPPPEAETGDVPVAAESVSAPPRDLPPSAAPNRASTSDGRWWRDEAASTVGNPEQALESRSMSPRGEIVLSSQILAMVGTQPILAGELLGRVNELLAPYVDQLPESQLQEQRWLLMQKMLPSAIEAKLVYLDFLRTMPDKQVELVRSNVYEQFDKEQLPRMVEQAKLKSSAELDAKMRSLGSSLDNTRRAFFEQVAAREMIRQKTEGDHEVTHDELLQYYRDHLGEYEYEAKARWEHLMARFSDFDRKEEAYRAIAQMGNSVLRGTPLEVVARRESQGPNAHNGGQYDWTTKGSLVSTVIDEAIFTLPVGKLSRILEDDKGFHIVRVLERKDAGRIPFQQTQREIRDTLKDQHRDARVKEYLEGLKRDTYVWNYFNQANDPRQIAREPSQTR